MNPNKDTAIIEKIKSGDILAFKEIYRLYYQHLLSFGKRYIDSEEEVEDCIQTIFVTIWEKRLSLQITNLKQYLTTAVKHACLNYLQKQITASKYTSTIEYEIKLEELQQIETEEIEKDKEIEIEQVHAYIQKLPEKTKEVISLKYIQGFSAQEISEKTGTSKRTVETQLYKGIKMLAEMYGLKILLLAVFLENQYVNSIQNLSY